MATATALLRASHPGPTLAVTTVTVLLALGPGHGWRTALVGAAVFCGQLSVGWSNDLIDAERDAAVGRRDKPIATGQVSRRLVRGATAAALAVCVVLSLALGIVPGLMHLVLGVGSGWAYNLGLKSTAYSWVPYLVAFGSLPVVVRLALDPPGAVPVWMVVVAALLGVGAHLANVLPDLADDAATGVRGLPHRLGARASGLLALLLLGVASVVATVAPPGDVPTWSWFVLGVVAVLCGVALARGGRALFRAAMVVALIDVVVLVVRSGG